MITKCRHCRRDYSTIAEAAACCLFAPKKPAGWCAWCGRDCPGTFCSRPCAVAFHQDALASHEAPPARGWCAWCGKDCRGTFCNKACRLQYGKDTSRAA